MKNCKCCKKPMDIDELDYIGNIKRPEDTCTLCTWENNGLRMDGYY